MVFSDGFSEPASQPVTQDKPPILAMATSPVTRDGRIERNETVVEERDYVRTASVTLQLRIFPTSFISVVSAFSISESVSCLQYFCRSLRACLLNNPKS
jgi:hypothetical protein